jgi:alpha-tubulin suppressor-like RCC1 family protein
MPHSKELMVRHGRQLTSDSALLALGDGNTCAYVTAGDGALKCWGTNSEGQLGDGTEGTGADNRYTPTTINVGGPVGLLALGSGHVCAYTTAGAGALKCWGWNDYGQLGDGTKTDRRTPTTINVGGPVGLLALGRYHTCAFVTAGGALKCWGLNAYGQLGDGTTTDRRTPTTIDVGGPVGPLGLVRKLEPCRLGASC